MNIFAPLEDKRLRVADEVRVFNKPSMRTTVWTAYGKTHAGMRPYAQVLVPWLPPGKPNACPRCGGTGYINAYIHVAAGICFLCQSKAECST